MMVMVMVVPRRHHRSSHQGLSDRRDPSGKHEEQRRDAKVRYRLAYLQPRAFKKQKSQVSIEHCVCANGLDSSNLPVSVTLKKNVIVITV